MDSLILIAVMNGVEFIIYRKLHEFNWCLNFISKYLFDILKLVQNMLQNLVWSYSMISVVHTQNKIFI